MILYDLAIMILKDIGKQSPGDAAPDSETINDVVSRIIMVASELDDEGFWHFAQVRESFTLTTNKASYSWGVTTPASDFTTERPLRVSNCFIRDGSSDFPVDIIGPNEYESFIDKTTTGRPEKVWLNFDYPAVEAYFYFTPDSNYTVFFDSEKELNAISSTLTATIILPNSHLQALRWLSDLDLCPMFEKEPTPYMIAKADSCLRSVKALNAANRAEPVKLNLPTVKPGGSQGTILSY